MEIIQKPTFRKVYKRLHPQEKKLVDEAIQTIIQNPTIGELKKGDLSGLFVYKFKVNKQQKLLAYTWGKTELFLASMGSHENFYRDLKKARS